MEFIDYYKILELDKKATADNIKKAYRKLARKYHPDLNPSDESAKKKFQQINEANEVLSDPEKRKKFDQHGQDWKHADEFAKANQQGQSRSHATGDGQRTWREDEHDYSDFFASMFGDRGAGSRGSQVRFRGQDFNASLNLNIKDVYQKQQQTLAVNGKNIRLTIPAGVENGQTIKIAGHGGEGMNGGPGGDLYLTFQIANNTRFRRDGSNLYSDVDIDLYTAVLGGEITTDTFEGKVKLQVTAGTQNSTKVKLKGKGFPVYKKEGEFGDLVFTYRVKIPVVLSEQERALFVQLSKLQKHEN
ncbi:MAG: J domain-containing protein [Flavobacteriales bacterium]|nr:J domain-containing protein [Flavobacteriales bacterium]